MNLLYIQSGGPTSVINASAAGVIKACKKIDSEIDRIYAAIHGIYGLLNNKLFDITNISGDDLDLLYDSPSMAFGSSRYKINDRDETKKDLKKILEVLREYQISSIVINGGNGTVRMSCKLIEFLQEVGYECKVIVVPKTVDNDTSQIDHTPGFPSAARHIILNIKELCHDFRCYDGNLIAIVEVMGRDTGFLAAASIVACKDGNGPDLIYVPEHSFSVAKLIQDIKEVLKKKKECVVVVAEGIKDSEGRYMLETLASRDNTYLNMGGVASCLKVAIANEFDCKVKAIDLGLMQRCSTATVSKLDQEEAEMLGRFAVEAILAGETGKMVTISREEDMEYKAKIGLVDLAEVVKEDNLLPKKYITKDGNFIEESYLKYIEPLIGKIPKYFDNKFLGGNNV